MSTPSENAPTAAVEVSSLFRLLLISVNANPGPEMGAVMVKLAGVEVFPALAPAEILTTVFPLKTIGKLIVSTVDAVAALFTRLPPNVMEFPPSVNAPAELSKLIPLNSVPFAKSLVLVSPFAPLNNKLSPVAGNASPPSQFNGFFH